MTDNKTTEVVAPLPETGFTSDSDTQPNSADGAPEQGGEEASLLAGRFKTPADLEKAYKELESKLGASKTPEASPTPQPAQPGADAPSLFTAEEQAQFRAELASGELTEASREALAAKGVTPEMAQMYYQGIQAQGERDLDTYINSEGGMDAIDRGRQWALENWSPESQQAWQERMNAAVAAGDYAAVKNQWQMVMAQYKADRDTYPETSVRGMKAGPVEPFSTQEEMIAAMSDPRYQRGEVKYVNHVRERLRVSPF